MENLFLISGIIFVIGYIFIAIEHKTHLNKSGIALLTGVILWLIVAITAKDKTHVTQAIAENGAEIFSIVIFLLAAMTIVELLSHYGFFDWIFKKIIQKKMSQMKLFWLLGGLTFIMSAFLDNLTTTLIMIQIGSKIYKNKNNFLIYVANTVVAANAGGAFSPIGDVTTIMLWLAGKFNAVQIISIGIVPALISWAIPQYLLGRKITNHDKTNISNGIDDTCGNKPHWSIIFIGIISFILPVIFNLVNLPPFLGLLFGVGILWVVIDYKAKNGDEHCLAGKITSIIQKTDLTTLKFFVGILLAIGALSYIGLLKGINDFLFGQTIDISRLVLGTGILGVVSSVLDNVPLVAAAIKMFPVGVGVPVWALLGITVGTGGSLLVIGSAAGVAAMGQVKELNFFYYLKNVTFPVFVGYILAIFSWIVLMLLL